MELTLEGKKQIIHNDIQKINEHTNRKQFVEHVRLVHCFLHKITEHLGFT